MRPIKFRAYDPETQKMYSVLGLSWHGEKTITLQFNPVIRKRLSDIYLMQYTGLKDKNGVEIFEGDIVEFWHKATPDNTTIYEVIYAAPMFKYRRTEQDTRVVQNSGVYYLCEVIGNIYENQELLK